MQDHNPPFQTNNVALAFALYAGGVPFPADPSGPIPFENIYDEEIISRISNRRRELGLTDYAGMTLESAIRQAVKDGERGQFAYCFERTEDLERLIKAFDEQQDQINRLEDSALYVLNRLLTEYQKGEIDEMEYRVRESCVILRARKLFLEEWRNTVPLVRIRGAGKPVTTTNGRGEKVTRFPGFKLMSLNAKADTRERLGL